VLEVPKGDLILRWLGEEERIMKVSATDKEESGK